MQSQVLPTTATVETQAGSNSPQVPQPPDKTTSEGSKQSDEAPCSAAGSHESEHSNGNRTWSQIIRTYSACGQAIESIKTILLQHLGQYVTLHNIPISMDDLDGFAHRYTANTFKLLSVVAPRPGPRIGINKVVVLSDQEFESILLTVRTSIILFVRLQERPDEHWVLVKADLSTLTLTYYDPIDSIVDKDDAWFTQTCGEVEIMLRKSAGRQHLDHLMMFPFTMERAKVCIMYSLRHHFPIILTRSLSSRYQELESMKTPGLWCGNKLN